MSAYTGLLAAVRAGYPGKLGVRFPHVTPANALRVARHEIASVVGALSGGARVEVVRWDGARREFEPSATRADVLGFVCEAAR